MEIEKETLLSIIVCLMPGSLGSFIDNFISLINELATQYRNLIVVYFNVDRMFPENVAKVGRLIRNFTLYTHSQYLTHIHGGFLDVVFGTSISMLLLLYHHPNSEHFAHFFQI